MKTLLDSVAKLDQKIQTLEERQPKLTISKTTMMGLLTELPIMALSDFEKFEDDLVADENISLEFVSTIQTNFEYLITFIHLLEYVYWQHWLNEIL
jgi:hypothetical protein